MTSKLFTIRCENQKGMLNRILSVFERPNYGILSINQSVTDINGIILIIIESKIPAAKAEVLLTKIECIVGVIDLVISYGDFLRSAFFQLSAKGLNDELWKLIGAHGASLVSMSENTLLIQKSGKIGELNNLYRVLQSEGLMGACLTPIPVNEEGLLSV